MGKATLAEHMARHLRAGYPCPMVENLPDIARATVARHGMFPEAGPVLALVSGGADSVALLSLLAAGDIGPVGPVRVLHVDHMLRGEDSDADAAFVEELCASLEVDCRVARFDVAAFAQEAGLNLEDAGRRVRYRFAEEGLDALCAETGARPSLGRVAVAHTRDDHVETFVMRVLSGAGAGGLAGIRPVRGRIVRPLLDARRADIVGYLERLGRSWREDKTNTDVSRLRARVRHEVLPLLTEVDPGFVDSAVRLMDVLSQEDGLLQEMADAFLRDLDVSLGPEVALDLARLRTLSRPMARRVLRTAIVSAFPEASRITFDHVDALAEGVHADAFSRDVTGGLRAFIECGKIVVSRGEENEAPLEPVLLGVPGTADLGSVGRIEASVVEPPEVTDDPDTASIDAGSVRGPLTVDPPRAGDRMRPLGMTGTKKLTDMLAEAGIPARKRAFVPVVRDGDRIVWVAGVRLSEEYKVRPETERVIGLTWFRKR